VAGDSSLRIRQVRSASGTKPNQRATLAALGLGRPGAEVNKGDSPQLRGQLRVISHLIDVEEAG
jgi:large subunit ribosomal protein L30